MIYLLLTGAAVFFVCCSRLCCTTGRLFSGGVGGDACLFLAWTHIRNALRHTSAYHETGAYLVTKLIVTAFHTAFHTTANIPWSFGYTLIAFTTGCISSLSLCPLTDTFWWPIHSWQTHKSMYLSEQIMSDFATSFSWLRWCCRPRVRYQKESLVSDCTNNMFEMQPYHRCIVTRALTECTVHIGNVLQQLGNVKETTIHDADNIHAWSLMVEKC